jgi:hypothetical protein
VPLVLVVGNGAKFKLSRSVVRAQAESAVPLLMPLQVLRSHSATVTVTVTV